MLIRICKHFLADLSCGEAAFSTARGALGMSLIVIRLRGRAKKMHTFGDPLLDAALDCYISREVSSVSAKKIHPCLGLLTFPCWIRGWLNIRNPSGDGVEFKLERYEVHTLVGRIRSTHHVIYSEVRKKVRMRMETPSKPTKRWRRIRVLLTRLFLNPRADSRIFAWRHLHDDQW